jgi:hypothetical protein
MGARLLTADARILDYAAANYGVRVHDARLWRLSPRDRYWGTFGPYSAAI